MPPPDKSRRITAAKPRGCRSFRRGNFRGDEEYDRRQNAERVVSPNSAGQHAACANANNGPPALPANSGHQFNWARTWAPAAVPSGSKAGADVARLHRPRPHENIPSIRARPVERHAVNCNTFVSSADHRPHLTHMLAAAHKVACAAKACLRGIRYGRSATR